MDLKLRIIIAFFSVIALFYICQFIISFMSKKEHFSSRYYDDVEKYEDAPEASKSKISDAPNESRDVGSKSDSTDNYDLRIFLLQQIDTLNITDSKVKASLMEKLFTPESMKDLKPMSNEQRIKKVNDVFHEVHGDKIIEKTVEVDRDAEALHNQIKNNFIAEKEKLVVPEMKDYFDNDFKNRVNKASDKLDNVIDGLKDLKDILKGNDNIAKENYIPDLPVPPPATIATPKAKYTASPVKLDQQPQYTAAPVTSAGTMSTKTPTAPTIASGAPPTVTAPSADNTPAIERYTERYIGTSIASSAGNPILSQAAGISAPSHFIEGFENIRAYAMY